MHESEQPSPATSSEASAVSREDLIAMVARALQDPTVAYAVSVLAGRTLAAQSKLPKAIAENLGAGFGQWHFFPEPTEIVDFAHGYVPPTTQAELWVMARAWASDDAAGRHTMMALVGREILQSELRRIDEPSLRELLDQRHPVRERALREKLGLDVPAIAESKRKPAPKAAAPKPAAPKPAATAAAATAGPMKMPVVRRPPAVVKPALPPKRFTHPKFGEGELERFEGEGPDAKLTVRFATGSKTVLARFVTETTPAVNEP